MKIPKEHSSMNSSENESNNDENNILTDFIVAIFVVIFDTKHGNVIEWGFPEDVDIKGIEFKSLVSGAHTITEDFVYFRHQQYYGLSCFALKTVTNADERGARMKSVGILCAKYTSLHEHQEFLQLQVRKQLDTPYQYEDLIRYFNSYRCCPKRNNYINGSSFTDELDGWLSHNDLPIMKITHPTGCFSQFINYFGQHIFVLWKFLLLRKRILFVAPPPVGIQCFRVYCTGLLGSNGMRLPSLCRNDMLFNIGLCDYNAIGNLDSFVACSSESILKSKPELYDLYVDRQTPSCNDLQLNEITKLNSADQTRFNRLKKYHNEQLTSGGEVVNDEKMYTRFFIEQNNRIFKVLYEISSRKEKLLEPSHINEMGLDPYSDYQFLNMLIDIYNIDLAIARLPCKVVCCR